MATPVIMPRQGQSVESCILTEWKVKQGDSVSEGDVLAVIETDKASFDLESTASGKVLELFWEADDDVPVLANVLVIGEDGENVEEFRPAGEGASVPDVSSSTDATVTEAPSSVVESTILTASAPISSNEVPLGGISAGVGLESKLAFRHGWILKLLRVRTKWASN